MSGGRPWHCCDGGRGREVTASRRLQWAGKFAAGLRSALAVGLCGLYRKNGTSQYQYQGRANHVGPAMALETTQSS